MRGMGQSFASFFYFAFFAIFEVGWGVSFLEFFSVLELCYWEQEFGLASSLVGFGFFPAWRKSKCSKYLCVFVDPWGYVDAKATGRVC
jgi:hypothetical protein